jgi:hypothetical protein
MRAGGSVFVMTGRLGLTKGLQGVKPGECRAFEEVEEVGHGAVRVNLNGANGANILVKAISIARPVTLCAFGCAFFQAYQLREMLVTHVARSRLSWKRLGLHMSGRTPAMLSITTCLGVSLICHRGNRQRMSVVPAGNEDRICEGAACPYGTHVDPKVQQ